MNVDNEEEATARAFAAIEETLQGFSSPMMGRTQPTYSHSHNNNHSSAMEWMQEELKDDTDTTSMRPTSSSMGKIKTPKRTPLMERAGTPIMSNSSRLSRLQQQQKKQQQQKLQRSQQTPGSATGRSKYSLGNDSDSDNENDSADDMARDEPLPVQTPLQRNVKPQHGTPGSSARLRTSSTSNSSRKSNSNSTSTSGSVPVAPTTAASASVSLKQSVFFRHHNALWNYLAAKKNLDNRMDLERKERQLEEESNQNDNDDDDDMELGHAVSKSLLRQECNTEVEYCQGLCQIGYGLTSVMDGSSSSSTTSNNNDKDNDNGPMEEGHFWDLLASLRKLGLPALIWYDDPTSMTQNKSSQAFYLQQLATTKMHSTPKELIDTMLSGAQTQSQTQSQSHLPLVLQRKQELLKWIQSCLELESKDTKAVLLGQYRNRTLPSPSHPDDATIPSLLSETDSDLLQKMARVCLSLFLEGKHSEALDVARSCGQSWRASAWNGGAPCGTISHLRDDTKSIEHVSVGNPNRFLWKRQVWKTGRKLLLQHTTSQQQQYQQQQQHQHQHQHQHQQSSGSSGSSIGLEEAAIYSILSDDFQNALDNPCIRSSWTRSLCVLLMGIRGRTVDEVLHRRNSYKRRSSISSSGSSNSISISNSGTTSASACFPGYQYEQQENEQLMHTTQLGTMTEAEMATMLSNSHFLKQRQQQQQQHKTRRPLYKSAIMAFMVGKSAILEFCARETSRMVSDIVQVSGNNEYDDEYEYANKDWEGVRFLTHLTLFLDSLQGSSTPIVCGNITDQKNAILYQYVQYLESRPDLWRMITLYVSLLPNETVLVYYPAVLAKIRDDAERQFMNDELHKLMPSMELPLLRRVVRLSLSEPQTFAGLYDNGNDTNNDTNNDNDNDMDTFKCKSLWWLLQKEEHLADAVVCANILLREFFRNEEEDKTMAAMTFLNEYLPEGFLDLVSTAFASKQQDSDETDDNVATVFQAAKVNNAVTEHMAYIVYLEAYGAFEKWKEILRATPTTSSSSLENGPSYSNNLNETEQAIADSNVLRSWVKEKKKHLETTLGAAEEARMAWHTVLTHPGGWLSVDDDDEVSTSPTYSNGVGSANATADIDMDMDMDATAEEQQRRADIQAIRSRHLVLAANLYHQVCEETAAWLSRSLHEAEDFHLSREEVLHKLRFGGSNNNNNGMDEGGERPGSHTPEYWYQHALDLATLVASDKHGIHKAFPPIDLQELITKLGETAVSKLMNV